MCRLYFSMWEEFSLVWVEERREFESGKEYDVPVVRFDIYKKDGWFV